jgi:hypothetical protein
MRDSPLVQLLFNPGLTAFGYQFRAHSLADRELMLQQIFVRLDTVVTEAPSVTLVEIEKDDTLYLITKKGHFAHPSLLKRTLVKQDQERRVEVSGLSACSAETMSIWMAQFQEQDAQMRSHLS